MNQMIFYANGGSGNHGCEAIVRSMNRIIGSSYQKIVLSNGIKEDIKYGLDQVAQLFDVKEPGGKDFEYVKTFLRLKLFRNKYAFDLLPYIRALKRLKQQKEMLALSLGGDNYCYGGTDFYYALDNLLHSYGIKTALVGCSIEPEVIACPSVLKDLRLHTLIIARESVTYDALKNMGLQNIRLLPDPAFQLETKKEKLPEGFIEGNTIGLNLSPLIEKCCQNHNLARRNIGNLLDYIIQHTDMQIALIPHVVWKSSDDMEVLKPIYEKYKTTGRIVLIHDCPAEELKGYIARCRFLIAARTHASVAAYSTGVPTLVIGYSVKAKGIAKDIFGSFENYVLPTQNIEGEMDMVNALRWLMDNEEPIKKHLAGFIPAYCEKAACIGQEIENLCK